MTIKTPFDLSGVPPTLLVSSTRDLALSGTSIFGRALVERSVDLHHAAAGKILKVELRKPYSERENVQCRVHGRIPDRPNVRR